MNHSYHLLWDDVTQRYVPAPETARGRGKSRTAFTLAPTVLLLGALLAAPAGAQALPTGGKVMSGQASIGQNGSQMTIDQASPKAILHWQGFDIGSGATVQFKQPDANAVALNRVVAGNASRIDGQLSANGQVWLVNPNGVVFGQGSQVNVSALVASTLDIANEDFNVGKQVFTRGAARGGITNQGNITVADGATLALLAPTVRNEGTLSARRGNVVLAGGDKVTLQAGVDGRLQLAADPATVRTLIENKHLITADGGQVVMTSSAADTLSASVVSNTGTVQARTLAQKGGRILLLGDMQHGKVVHSGLLDTGAPDGGNGGFVQTSAAKVQTPAGALVTTAASQGTTGNWLISPADLTISTGGKGESGSRIGADTLMENLANTSITLQTASGGTRRDIDVNAPVSWSQNTLKLNAHGNINVNAVMTASGTAGLEMNYGGYSTTHQTVAVGSGLRMKLTHQGFTGRVDFKDVLNQIIGENRRLKINGASYTLLTELGQPNSTTRLDLQGTAMWGQYALGADIDASNSRAWSEGAGFAPLGGPGEGTFIGSFEGLGHTITGLHVTRPTQDFVGLFSRNNGAIRNVGLEKLSVEGADHVGGLVGRNSAIAGYEAVIDNVYATGQVRGKSNVGGLAGGNMAFPGTTARISGSYAIAAVSGIENIGGLVGANSVHGGKTEISDDYAFGRESGSVHVGGLVGLHEAAGGGTADILRSHASAAASGGRKIAGLQAKSEGKNVGGLVGSTVARSASTALISQSYAEGAVIGTKQVGGLVGSNIAAGGTAEISESAATGPVRGLDHVGGLTGINLAYDGGTASISRSDAYGAAFGKSEGGIVEKVAKYFGTVAYSVMYGCARVGTKVFKENIADPLGHLRDWNESRSGKAEISNSTGVGQLSGANYVGALTGRNHARHDGTARISHSHAYGTVFGIQRSGNAVASGAQRAVNVLWQHTDHTLDAPLPSSPDVILWVP